MQVRFFRSKFFLVCLCAAVVLTVFPTGLALMGIRDPLRGLIRTVTLPFRWGVTVVGDAAGGFVDYFTEYDRLREENESLRQALADREDAEALARALKDENSWLKAYFGMAKTDRIETLESARVLSCSVTGSSATLTLNKGSVSGIAKGMPVVVLEGVLGYVREVGLDWCTVSVLIEPGNGAGVYVERSQASGRVEGTLSLFGEGLCRLTMNQLDADVQVGDRIYTSGAGSVYPADLLVGSVVSVSVDNFSKKIVAEVRSVVTPEALQGLTRVMILTKTTLVAHENESDAGNGGEATP